MEDFFLEDFFLLPPTCIFLDPFLFEDFFLDAFFLEDFLEDFLLVLLDFLDDFFLDDFFLEDFFLEDFLDFLFGLFSLTSTFLLLLLPPCWLTISKPCLSSFSNSVVLPSEMELLLPPFWLSTTDNHCGKDELDTPSVSKKSEILLSFLFFKNISDIIYILIYIIFFLYLIIQFI